MGRLMGRTAKACPLPYKTRQEHRAKTRAVGRCLCVSCGSHATKEVYDHGQGKDAGPSCCLTAAPTTPRRRIGLTCPSGAPLDPGKNRPRPPRRVVHYVPAVSDVCRRRVLGSVCCVAAVPDTPLDPLACRGCTKRVVAGASTAQSLYEYG